MEIPRKRKYIHKTSTVTLTYSEGLRKDKCNRRKRCEVLPFGDTMRRPFRVRAKASALPSCDSHRMETRAKGHDIRQNIKGKSCNTDCKKKLVTAESEISTHFARRRSGKVKKMSRNHNKQGKLRKSARDGVQECNDHRRGTPSRMTRTENKRISYSQSHAAVTRQRCSGVKSVRKNLCRVGTRTRIEEGIVSSDRVERSKQPMLDEEPRKVKNDESIMNLTFVDEKQQRSKYSIKDKGQGNLKNEKPSAKIGERESELLLITKEGTEDMLIEQTYEIDAMWPITRQRNETESHCYKIKKTQGMRIKNNDGSGSEIDGYISEISKVAGSKRIVESSMKNNANKELEDYDQRIEFLPIISRENLKEPYESETTQIKIIHEKTGLERTYCKLNSSDESCKEEDHVDLSRKKVTEEVPNEGVEANYFSIQSKREEKFKKHGDKLGKRREILNGQEKYRFKNSNKVNKKGFIKERRHEGKDKGIQTDNYIENETIELSNENLQRVYNYEIRKESSIKELQKAVKSWHKIKATSGVATWRVEEVLNHVKTIGSKRNKQNKASNASIKHSSMKPTSQRTKKSQSSACTLKLKMDRRKRMDSLWRRVTDARGTAYEISGKDKRKSMSRDSIMKHESIENKSREKPQPILKKTVQNEVISSNKKNSIKSMSSKIVAGASLCRKSTKVEKMTKIPISKPMKEKSKPIKDANKLCMQPCTRGKNNVFSRSLTSKKEKGNTLPVNTLKQKSKTDDEKFCLPEVPESGKDDNQLTRITDANSQGSVPQQMQGNRLSPTESNRGSYKQVSEEILADGNYVCGPCESGELEEALKDSWVDSHKSTNVHSFDTTEVVLIETTDLRSSRLVTDKKDVFQNLSSDFVTEKHECLDRAVMNNVRQSLLAPLREESRIHDDCMTDRYYKIITTKGEKDQLLNFMQRLKIKRRLQDRLRRKGKFLEKIKVEHNKSAMTENLEKYRNCLDYHWVTTSKGEWKQTYESTDGILGYHEGKEKIDESGEIMEIGKGSIDEGGLKAILTSNMRGQRAAIRSEVHEEYVPSRDETKGNETPEYEKVCLNVSMNGTTNFEQVDEGQFSWQCKGKIDGKYGKEEKEILYLIKSTKEKVHVGIYDQKSEKNNSEGSKETEMFSQVRETKLKPGSEHDLLKNETQSSEVHSRNNYRKSSTSIWSDGHKTDCLQECQKGRSTITSHKQIEKPAKCPGKRLPNISGKIGQEGVNIFKGHNKSVNNREMNHTDEKAHTTLGKESRLIRNSSKENKGNSYRHRQHISRGTSVSKTLKHEVDKSSGDGNLKNVTSKYIPKGRHRAELTSKQRSVGHLEHNVTKRGRKGSSVFTANCCVAKRAEQKKDRDKAVLKTIELKEVEPKAKQMGNKEKGMIETKPEDLGNGVFSIGKKHSVKSLDSELRTKEREVKVVREDGKPYTTSLPNGRGMKALNCCRRTKTVKGRSKLARLENFPDKTSAHKQVNPAREEPTEETKTPKLSVTSAVEKITAMWNDVVQEGKTILGTLAKCKLNEEQRKQQIPETRIIYKVSEVSNLKEVAQMYNESRKSGEHYNAHRRRNTNLHHTRCGNQMK